MAEYIDILLSFLALAVLEIVLGIDNLVFLAIVSHKLPKSQQRKARQIGLTLAWLTRLLLLASAIWLTKLTTPLLTLFKFSLSGRDLFLLSGGIFLIVKATQEIHSALEPSQKTSNTKPKYPSFFWAIAQIAILDIIFSLDSVLTAIGLTDRYWIMVSAITIAILVMLFASELLSKFIESHPTIKMLALSFLILIGTVLMADGLGYHIPRGYIYFAMGFSIMVELLNMLYQKKKLKIKE